MTVHRVRVCSPISTANPHHIITAHEPYVWNNSKFPILLCYATRAVYKYTYILYVRHDSWCAICVCFWAMTAAGSRTIFRSCRLLWLWNVEPTASEKKNNSEWVAEERISIFLCEIIFFSACIRSTVETHAKGLLRDARLPCFIELPRHAQKQQRSNNEYIKTKMERGREP